LVSDSVNCTVVRAVVLTQYRRVTDGRTDSACNASITARCKNPRGNDFFTHVHRRNGAIDSNKISRVGVVIYLSRYPNRFNVMVQND